MPRTLLLPGDRPLINLALLGATLLTTFWVFWGFHTNWSPDLSGPLAFSLCTVLILGAHEMGHYVLARLHGVDTSLPYFIPLPLGFGTLGAVIRIRGRIPTRNALVDIGAAGPLAGLAVAIPVLWYGLGLSQVGDAPPIETGFPHPWSAISLAGELWTYLGSLWSEAPSAQGPVMAIPVYGDGLLMQGLQRLVLGPIPEGKEVFVHPMVIAGWFGLLVTMLNLCPIGQLDGGHVAYAVLGKWARPVGKAAALGLLFLALFYSVSWLLWLAVSARFIGFGHPEVIFPEEPVSTGRKLIALLCLIALALCVVPVPIQMVTVG